MLALSRAAAASMTGSVATQMIIVVFVADVGLMMASITT
jgi:hypothetical protein